MVVVEAKIFSVFRIESEYLGHWPSGIDNLPRGREVSISWWERLIYGSTRLLEAFSA
jgi:hypothetical protein